MKQRFSLEEQMLEALAIHEAAHAVIDTVLGLSVHCTFINPLTRNGRTEYTPVLTEQIEVLLRAPSLDQTMESLAEQIATAAAAGYVAEARHRVVLREAICLTQDSPGYSDRQLMEKLCAKLHKQEGAQFAKWEDEAETLTRRYAPEIETVAHELHEKLHLTGVALQSLLKGSLKCCT